MSSGEKASRSASSSSSSRSTGMPWDQAILPLSDPSPCPSLEFTGQEGYMCFCSWSLDFLTSVVPGDSFPGVLL